MRLQAPALAPLGWIDDPAIAADNGTRRQAGGFDVARSKDMQNLISRGEQVIGDDSPVATPPQDFGAHEDAAVPAGEFAQLCEAGGEGWRQRVVGIIAKAHDLPVAVG